MSTPCSGLAALSVELLESELGAAGFEEAIIGTLTEGPALYGDVVALDALPSGGNSTLKMG